MDSLRKVGFVAFGICACCLLTACPAGPSPGKTQDVTLRFSAQAGDSQIECGELYDGFGTTGESIEIVDLRLYVSNIRLINETGDEVPLTLDQDGKWQVEDVAFLDFEDATGACSDTGTDDLNHEVIGTVPEGIYTGVVFDFGVPFDLNHDDLSAAPSPLNVSALFWTWAVGHMFCKIDIQSDIGAPWSMHLGSLACESDGSQDPPISACANPNRPTIRFESIDPDIDTIVFDIQELFADSDLTQDTPDTAAGCQSVTEDAGECEPIFPNLGLDFATGDCTNECADQTVFRVESGVARGLKEFNQLRSAVGGGTYACASCHGAEGAGDFGPDIRSSPADHLFGHSHGTFPHPSGVKFPDMSLTHCDDIAAYLGSLCAADPECPPFDESQHQH